MSYRDRLDLLKSNYNKRLGQFQSISKDVVKLDTDITNLTERKQDLTKVSTLLQTISERARENAKTHLETVVSNALQYISGGSYQFQIEITEKRGRPDAEFYVVSTVNGIQSKQKPQDACGGGFVDIISTALRYAYVELFSDPKIQGGIIVDEPGKMVSEQASIKFAEFVAYLGEEFDRQTIMITHNDSLQSIADKTYNVRLVSGVSVISEGIGEEDEYGLDDEE